MEREQWIELISKILDSLDILSKKRTEFGNLAPFEKLLMQFSRTIKLEQWREKPQKLHDPKNAYTCQRLGLLEKRERERYFGVKKRKENKNGKPVDNNKTGNKRQECDNAR